jgi:hypothetical protein
MCQNGVSPARTRWSRRLVGFRCGFLGLLDMDMVRGRLELRRGDWAGGRDGRRTRWELGSSGWVMRGAGDVGGGQFRTPSMRSPGARSDRPALAAMMTGARAGEFDVVLVDDLSRLARDNHLMLSIIAEPHFEGIRVISVAHGLDSTRR